MSVNSANYKPMVLDLSHHNTIPNNLMCASGQGIKAIIHKATEGLSSGGVDKKYKARRSLAKDAGMLWGAYHFFRPGNISAQVDHFIAVAEPDENTLLALDHEDERMSAANAKVFLKLLQEKTGRSPVFYSGHVAKEQLKNVIDLQLGTYRLWLADYNKTFTFNKSWKAPWLWQYTERGKWCGVEGDVDGDAYADTPEHLALEWAGTLPSVEVA